MFLDPWSPQLRQRRQRQIGSLIHRELGELLQHELHDPRLGFATITEVKVASNLKRARIYVSVMGNEEERNGTMAALKAATGFVRHELAARLKLRYTPQIEFVPDLTLDRAARLDTLIDQAQEGTTAADGSDD